MPYRPSAPMVHRWSSAHVGPNPPPTSPGGSEAAANSRTGDTKQNPPDRFSPECHRVLMSGGGGDRSNTEGGGQTRASTVSSPEWRSSLIHYSGEDLLWVRGGQQQPRGDAGQENVAHGLLTVLLSRTVLWVSFCPSVLGCGM